MKNSLMKNNGITLLALLITIIVMLILAGVTISMLFGENGVVDKVRQAQEEHIIGQEKEEIRLAYAAAWIRRRPKRVNAIDVETELINHRQKDDVEGTDVRDGKKKGILIYYEETDHAYFIELEDKDVDPEGYIPGEKIELVNKDDYKTEPTNVYAILYTNGNLVFNSSGYTDVKYGDVDNAETFKVRVIEENINKNYTSSILPPWAGNDVKKVIFEDKIVPTSTQAWFANLTQLVEIVDIENLYTDNVRNMNAMFYNCKVLQTLDLTEFNTAKVEDMGNMFGNCNALQELDLSNFNTSLVINMGTMFDACNNLKTLDLSSFNTSKVIYMTAMFRNCKNLQTLNLSSFNTSEVTTMVGMFYYCEKLQTLNLSNFNTSKVTDMNRMFGHMHAINSLDLSSFNTSNVTNMYHMFTDWSGTELDLSSFVFNQISEEDIDDQRDPTSADGVGDYLFPHKGHADQKYNSNLKIYINSSQEGWFKSYGWNGKYQIK